MSCGSEMVGLPPPSIPRDAETEEEEGEKEEEEEEEGSGRAVDNAVTAGARASAIAPVAFTSLRNTRARWASPRVQERMSGVDLVLSWEENGGKGEGWREVMRMREDERGAGGEASAL